MALRNEDEHSYRSLAMQSLEANISELATEAVRKAPKEGEQATPEHTLDALHSALNIANLKLACNWLEALDEKLCPEVQSLEEQLLQRIKNGETPQAVINDTISFLDKLIPSQEK